LSHYDEVLEEARNKATSSAKEYIPKLYDILTQEEHKTAEDARKIIEHDLLEYWSKATVTKWLPQETKDQEKVKAGKQGAKATNLVLAGGQTVTTNSDESNAVSPNSNEDKDNPLEIENDFLKEKNAELEDALKKTEQFKPATQLQESKVSLIDPNNLLEKTVLTEETVFEWLAKRHDKQTCFYFDTYGTNLLNSRIIENLKNSGVKVFKRLYFEV
jgi:hypothetical protein